MDTSFFPQTWEGVGNDGFRLMVPGGWLFHLSNDDAGVTAPVFIPDLNRLWILEPRNESGVTS